MKLMNVRRRAALLSFLLVPMFSLAQLVSVGDGGPGPVKAQHLTAELVSLAPSVSPGSSVEVGLVLALEEKWHVYWVNAGDSGEPPSIKWTLPERVTAGPIRFPVPSRLPLGPLMDYGYEDNTAFPVKISVAAGRKPGPIHLDAMVKWLVCREVCLPGKAHLGIDLNVEPNAPAGPMVGALAAAIRSVPPPLEEEYAVAVSGGQGQLAITLHNHPEAKAGQVEFYPYEPDLIVNGAEQAYLKTSDGFTLCVTRAEDPDHAGQYPKLPASLHGVIKLSDGDGYEFTAPIAPGDTSKCAAASAAAEAAPKGEKAILVSVNGNGPSAASLTALPAIGLAFLGGIILNLMPCVFPVLFLKGLALVQSSGEERSRMRSHGLVYTLGILVSFWAIVAVLLSLRATGSHIGWGFQLQSPTFVAVVASGLFFFALSLAGQFDLGLSLTSAGGELAKKEGYAGSFFTGILATIVATPCTAPLMGAAIGYALAQPAWMTFAVFTALALGLALPYLLLTLQPAWTRLLPRPGAWMETLKQLTAVPLFATVIWLSWVYARLHAGAEIGGESDSIAFLLLCFLVLAIAGWVLARWPGKWKSAIAATFLVIVALAIPLSQPRVVITSGPVPSGAANHAGGTALSWQPYSQATLDASRAAGKPVFIDFTAAWCLSCQVNEKLVLKSADVERELTAHHFTLMRADWTQYDPAITAQLASLNRSGVPTYVVYPVKGQPNVLPELLTKDLVLEAIKQ